MASSVGWEAFEERGKLAFVADAAHSRFSLKTRAGAGPAVVARVAHQAGASCHVVKFQSREPAHVFRASRFLRFAMQEVLGPMRAAPVVAAAAPAVADGKPKKKKSKKKKH